MTESSDYAWYQAYWLLSAIPMSAAFTTVYGKGVEHAASFFLAYGLNVLTVPIALFTDLFTGITGAEWFVLVIIWIGNLSIVSKVLD